ncbi:unnamed protein product [Cyclocybe aegerita]|uniref:F-box domain-containing protein n=1 Tax=Cyclocybe aegerita TaxID=1973307 RepID=A0A8S0WX90_CYCAE|nr:unnamed protein product [Cyclocybe aegerita]
MLNHQDLPPEIWLDIFDWATFNPNIITNASTPFTPIPDSTRDPNLQVRAALASVCRTWRKWAAQSLYQDVKIRRDAHALKQALERYQHAAASYGQLVRRVVLPYQSTVTGPSRTLESVEILKLCPHLHTLQRPQHSLADPLSFDYEAECPPFPSLRRLDWWHHNEADRTGGINALGVVLRNAPHLRYLFVGGVISHTCMEPGRVSLPDLETVRLQVRSGMLLRQMVSQWFLPSLKHIILDSPVVRDGSQAIWETFGEQLETMEFGKHVRFLISDFLTPCLTSCPNLKELNYYIFFTSPPESDIVHSKLTTVGLHAHVNALLVEGGSAWNLVEHHFEILTSPNLPALRRIVLYGDWRAVLLHSRFVTIKEMVKTSNRILELSHQARPSSLDIGETDSSCCDYMAI